MSARNPKTMLKAFKTKYESELSLCGSHSSKTIFVDNTQSNKSIVSNSLKNMCYHILGLNNTKEGKMLSIS